MRTFIALGIALALGVSQIGSAESVHVILTGSGGEEVYQERFSDWGARLSKALVARTDTEAANVVWLGELSEGSQQPGVEIDLETIQSTFADLAARLTENDDLYVYLIGHGSYYSRETKFHIPGPDLRAADMVEMLDGVTAKRILVLNAAPASAGYINALAGENRVVCTATKSVGEFNATRFMEFFIQALEDDSADRNHDERISFFELCAQAAELTESWYTAEALVASEHAIFDDNGDGLGTRLFDPLVTDDFDPEVFDGLLARRTFLRNYRFPDAAPDALVSAYLDTIDSIESLKLRKVALDEAAYYAELEGLLLGAARMNREIRGYQ